MRAAQIEKMTEGNEGNSDDGQNRLVQSMRGRERAAHEGEPHHRNHKWCCGPVLQRTPANGDCGNEHGKRQCHSMDFFREQKLAAQTECAHHHDAGETMQSAQARQPDSSAVQSASNR